MSSSSSKPFRSSSGSRGGSVLMQHQPTVAPSSFVLARDSEGPVLANFDAAAAASDNTTQQHGFSPYDFNGGTVAAVSGPDYCVVAADTRLSSGYEILSRHSTKLHALTQQAVLASSGCKTDVDQLRSWLDIKMKVRVVCSVVCSLVASMIGEKSFVGCRNEKVPCFWF